MSGAKKCDICGTLFEMPFIRDIRINKYSHGYGDFYLDLCDNCQKKLEDFVNNSNSSSEKLKFSPSDHVVVINKNSLNYKKTGVIEKYDPKLKKYKVLCKLNGTHLGNWEINYDYLYFYETELELQ